MVVEGAVDVADGADAVGGAAGWYHYGWWLVLQRLALISQIIRDQWNHCGNHAFRGTNSAICWELELVLGGHATLLHSSAGRMSDLHLLVIFPFSRLPPRTRSCLPAVAEGLACELRLARFDNGSLRCLHLGSRTIKLEETTPITVKLSVVAPNNGQ